MEARVIFIIFVCVYSATAYTTESITENQDQTVDTNRNDSNSKGKLSSGLTTNKTQDITETNEVDITKTNEVPALTVASMPTQRNTVTETPIINTNNQLGQELEEGINSKKNILQDDTVNTFILHNFLSDLEEKIIKLFKGFAEEKGQNVELKQEINGIKRNVQELQGKTDEISASLEKFMKNMAFMKDDIERQESEIAENYTMVQANIQRIKDNVEKVQVSLVNNAESLEILTHDMLEMKEEVKHMQQENSISNRSNGNLKGKLSSGLASNETKEIKETNEVDITKTNEVPASTVASMPTQMSTVTETPINMTTGTGTPIIMTTVAKTPIINTTVTETPIINTTVTETPIINTTVTETPISMTTCTEAPVIMRKSCLDLFYNERKTFHVDGIYNITLGQVGPISVYCDMTIDGGGWTVFQRRLDGSVNFSRNWNDYKTVFGNLTGEFWLGNDYLNLLTDNDEPHELRIELEDHDGNRAYAKYNDFMVGSESTNYQLQLNNYVGNAGDSLEKSIRGQSYIHNGMEFSTLDRDNDKSNGNCAVDFKGAWWHNSCFESNLNSVYQDQPLCKKPWACIVWNTWKGSWYSLKSTEMKFR
ncbi:angiopoietin-2-like [Mercenaria mercenaria]|uniref:angiopoietin-2-like n=1 Tax=Mercenaria mercenaria TaxID=6596 RepID=UPI00234E5A5E|nr:angiopoietin-2-like [Mercenaria mercenaria]